ncbi:hypothetical protein RAS1_44190 [Phycisphaerae bacterium RAS1]|nr:hypothetical protein RAS1_44190 [Phycisphaerae bacterium RAS1]
MRTPHLLLPTSLLLCGIVALTEDIPPGYYLSTIPSPPGWARYPAINNRGQVVFAVRADPYNADTSELYLYENGQVQQLTLDNVRDDFPDINDDGTIVWSRADGPGGWMQIAMLVDGQTTILTSGSLHHFAPRVNAAGHAVWYRWVGTGCAGTDADVMFFDGVTVKNISEQGYSNEAAKLNDYDEIVWVRYYDCEPPWQSDIMHYVGGATTQITYNRVEPQRCDINNAGQIAWYEGFDDQIIVWDRGVLSVLTTWGSGLYMSKNGGFIAFNRWHEDSQTWQVCIHHAGEIFELTADPHWNYDGRPNDQGETVWHAGTPFVVGLGCLRRFALGDLNCDRAIGVLDINPFVLALIAPATYSALYPACDAALGDLNQDGVVNVLDINPFVVALGAAARSE